MIFVIFTAIVFVSQLIIGFTIIFHLLKIDNKIIKCNVLLENAKPKISDVMKLLHGISIQMRELTPIFVENFFRIRNKIIRSRLESLISMLLFSWLNLRLAKKLKKSKIFRLSMKGLSLLQNVI